MDAMKGEKQYNDFNVKDVKFDKYSQSGASASKSKFENAETFRKGLSAYSLQDQRLQCGSACQYDTVNCSGVPLDSSPDGRTVYLDGTDAHTLLIGATGSKKSRLVVMPTIRTLTASGEGMVICDPKGEVYRRTATFLKGQGYEIHAINLREPQKGDGWNMLEIPYQYFCNGGIDKACEMINDATVNLMPVTAKDPYWDYSARDMLFGLILLLFHLAKDYNLPPEQISMAGVLKLREELFFCSISRKIMDSPLWNYAKNHAMVRTRLNGIVICPENTMSCIISTFDQHMTCFSLQPQIMDLLSSTTFSLDNLGFRKIALFLIMPDEKTTYHKIITICLKQIYEHLIDNAFRRTSNNRFPVRLNFVLDEFSSLPAISDFPQMISASRSRNIRFVLVVQSKHQLKQRYKEESETIMSNCMNWIFLTSRETNLLKEISELGGITGTKNEPLISISMLQHFDKEKGECLVLSGRKNPYIACLPDITRYDNDLNPERPLPVRNPLKTDKAFDQEMYFRNMVGKPTPQTKHDTSVQADIQAEMEAKFDELFGSFDDQ